MTKRYPVRLKDTGAFLFDGPYQYGPLEGDRTPVSLGDAVLIFTGHHWLASRALTNDERREFLAAVASANAEWEATMERLIAERDKGVTASPSAPSARS